MKTNPDDPVTGWPDTDVIYGSKGLTKREYFAAMALQGLVGNLDANSNADDEFVGRDAVQYADVLIKKLNEE